MNSQNLAVAISSGNVKLLSSIKGLGKKTAERIILELKDKLGIDGMPLTTMGVSMPVVSSQEMTDAIETLVLLGVKKPDATEAVKAVAKDDMSAETIVKLALTKLK